MKNTKKYIITIILFVVVMLLILLFFIFRYNYIHLLNKSRELLEYLYTLDIGEYKYKSGAIYTETEILSTDYYFEGNGNIKVDDYKNVSFIIQSGDYCVSKTQLGEIKIEKKECHDFVTIEAHENNCSPERHYYEKRTYRKKHSCKSEKRIRYKTIPPWYHSGFCRPYCQHPVFWYRKASRHSGRSDRVGNRNYRDGEKHTI